MNSMRLVAILLIVVGAVGLLYSGFSYTTQKEVVNIGSLKITADDQKTIPIPPIVGGLMLAGGVVMLVYGRKNA